MSAHVFIFRGNLTLLACDAWLLPTDSNLKVEGSWLTDLPDQTKKQIQDACRKPWPENGSRTKPVEVHTGPQPILVDVGADARTPLEWFLDGVHEFVQSAADLLRDRKPLNGRARHLIALPLVGTGKGGLQEVKGHIAQGLLTRLHEAARNQKLDLDVALVVRDAQALAATQRARGDALAACKAELLEEQRSSLDELASRARQGSLAIFSGAGIGHGAGLPDWNKLLERLGLVAGMTPDEIKGLEVLDYLDRASFLERRCQRKNINLSQEIAKLIQQNQHHSLTHGLLASLPVQAMVTQNYDDLLEKASRGAGRPLAVLPYEACDEAGKRWLLKMHGCVHHSEDIVLRRQDFLRYSSRSAALRGIVQTMLITQTMLFIGFSLVDPNFHQIADDVRQAVRPNGDETPGNSFGTALFLQPQPLLQELWEGELNILHMASPDDSTAEAARKLDIFLDLLLAQSTTNTAHLLDASFDQMLTPGERILGQELVALQRRLPAEAKATEAWKMMESLLAQLGATN